MLKLSDRLFGRLPLHFRILFRQFLLRVIDLEALSIQADVVGFLGQFAGVLIMLSLVFAVRLLVPLMLMSPADAHAFLSHSAVPMEQLVISTTMLAVGLITVLGWDATFPDRRDVMVLSPLPLHSRTILVAKLCASASVIVLGVLTLNVATGVVCPMLLGSLHNSVWGVLRFFAAYWFTVGAAAVFLYGSILTVQGFTSLLLPRRIFLGLSAILQLVAFGLFLAVYFLTPSLPALADFDAPANQWMIAYCPSYWFFALFNQLNGSLLPTLVWLALRAWIGLAIVLCGAAVSLLLCYLRTMKKTVEEPDLVPGAGGSHWTPRFGSALQTAIVLFTFRSLTRSRQHRVVYASYLSVVFAIALSLLRGNLSATGPRTLTSDFLFPTTLMMCFAVIGLRSVFPLPISLTANWVLRVTQFSPSQNYIAATRRSMLLFAVVPAWLVSAWLSLSFTPLQHVAEHLAVLALLGSIFAELSLFGFYKVPFTCSYLPGKSNIQFAFWGFVFVLLILGISFAPFELSTFGNPLSYTCLLFELGAAASGLWAFNCHRAKSAQIYFEDLPEEVITTLGLISAPPAGSE